MILLLAGGGSEIHTVSALMENEGLSHLCVFSDFAEAGTYGKGNAIVGKPDTAGFENLINDERISGIADISEGADVNQSLCAMKACKNLGIPYIKYIRMPMGRSEHTLVLFTGSYREVAKAVERRTSTLLYTNSRTARAIAQYTDDKNRLYTTILRGIRFDVDLALEFGLPILNIIETDGIDGTECVINAIERTEAGLIVCDGTISIPDKILAAKERNINVIITQNTGVEYTNVALSHGELIDAILSW